MASDEDRSTEGMVNSMMTCGLDMKLGLFLARSIRSGHVQFAFWLSRCVGGGLANSECSRTRDGCDGRGSAASRLRGVARCCNIPPSHTYTAPSLFLCAPLFAARCCIYKVRGGHVLRGRTRATTSRAEGHACAPPNAFQDHHYLIGLSSSGRSQNGH